MFKTATSNVMKQTQQNQVNKVALATLARAKEKIEAYMLTKDVTLSMLFSIIDTNSDR